MRGQSHRAPVLGPGSPALSALGPGSCWGGWGVPQPRPSYLAGREGEEASRGSAGEQGARVRCPDKLSDSLKVTQLVRSKPGAGGHPDRTNALAPTPAGGKGSSFPAP